MPTFDSSLFDDQRFDGQPAATSFTAAGPFSAEVKLSYVPIASIGLI